MNIYTIYILSIWIILRKELNVDTKYEKNAKILKALGDPNRLKIIELLSCEEKCACQILESFDFTQPTLSHHMKVLIDCGLIESRKDGVWNQYKLKMNNANKLVLFLMDLITEKDDCICNDKEVDVDENITNKVKNCEEQIEISCQNKDDECM